MRKTNFRNIAIIAHVDHGKTTLVDGLLRQSGIFRDNQVVAERIMDSMDLEREKGITIMAKNTAISYKGIKINIIDTPGHADFGGEVERGLNLVDGVLLLVDAAEGPLPQTRFVLKKAFEKKLPVILVINKIDRPDARIEEVVDMVYDLFIDLEADDTQIEFPILYSVARDGICHKTLGDGSTTLQPLFDAIIEHIPGPEVGEGDIPQFLITNLDYDSYVGQVGVGRMVAGSLEMNKTYAICSGDTIKPTIKFTALYTFEGLRRKPVNVVESGDIIAVAGIEGMMIGDTITSAADPRPLPGIHVEEPTISMIFYVNNGPFAGKEGKFLTSRNLKERLELEIKKNIALRLKYLDRVDAFEVCGRGEFQMAILIETMRREGFEMMVSKPRVLTKNEGGRLHEPVEKIYLDIPDEYIGIMTEKLAPRKGKMTNMINHGTGRVNLEFIIPSRGLIGFRNQFLTDTRGAGVMNSLFDGYAPWFGHIPSRSRGALVADREGRVNTYASFAMEDRGELFSEVGIQVYAGMVVGEHNRPGDLEVNITKEKKLTNMRASGSDDTITLRPPRRLSLEQCLDFIANDEVVEVTPKSIRLRKMELDSNKRAQARRREEMAAEAG